MTPGLAAAILGVGVLVVYFATTPGAFASLFGGPGAGGQQAANLSPCGKPFLNESELNYYLEKFNVNITPAQAASIGASAGAPVASVTFGLSIAIGALVGWLVQRNDNETKDDREWFAQRLGFPGDGLGVHTEPTVSITDLSSGLYSYLTFIGADELRHEAMAVIGRQDYQANAEWAVKVLVVLWRVGFFCDMESHTTGKIARDSTGHTIIGTAVPR
jgi:hypothetical protein